jgi:hypothetical protein
MKTTKELIIEDITAKVKAKLASQNVKLATINDLKKKSEILAKLTYDIAQKDEETYFKAQRVIKAFAEVQKLKDNFKKEMIAKDNVFKQTLIDYATLQDAFVVTASMYTKVGPLLSEARKEFDQIYKQAKDLGIDISKETGPIFQTLNNANETGTKDFSRFITEVKTKVIDKYKDVKFTNNWISQ